MHLFYVTVILLFAAATLSAMLGFVALTVEAWVVATFDDFETVRVGLKSSCVATSCFDAAALHISLCGRTGTSVSSKLNAAIAFFAMGSFLVGVTAMMACHELTHIHHIARNRFLDVTRASHARLIVERWRLPWIALLTCVVGLVFAIIAFIIMDVVFKSWLNCGKSVCDYFNTNFAVNANCHDGPSRGIEIAALVFNVIAILLALVWALYHRWLHNSIPDDVLQTVRWRQAEDMADPSLTQVSRSVLAEDKQAAGAVTGTKDESQSKLIPMASPGSPIPGSESGMSTSKQRRAAKSTASSECIVAHSPNGNAAPTSGTHQPYGTTPDGPPNNMDVSLPPGDDWIYTERTLFWSDKEGLYYDTGSRNFFDPASGLWFNPVQNRWFAIDAGGNETSAHFDNPPAAPGGGGRSRSHSVSGAALNMTPPHVTPTATSM
jgi:hypothetical protein